MSRDCRAPGDRHGWRRTHDQPSKINAVNANVSCRRVRRVYARASRQRGVEVWRARGKARQLSVELNFGSQAAKRGAAPGRPRDAQRAVPEWLAHRSRAAECGFDLSLEGPIGACDNVPIHHVERDVVALAAKVVIASSCEAAGAFGLAGRQGVDSDQVFREST